MRVQLLYFDGCPNTPAMRESLREAVQSIDDQIEIEEIDFAQLPATDRRRGYGSPTVLLNGADLMGSVPGQGDELSYRLYVWGVPSSTQIASLLLSKK